MTRPIVTPEEKKANATRYCTSPRQRRNALRWSLKTTRDRDFAFLVKTHMKNMRQGRAKAIAGWVGRWVGGGVAKGLVALS